MRRFNPRRLLLFPLLLALLAVYIHWGNTSLVLTEITVEDADIPAPFSGFRIAHISDLHNTQFGPDNSRLLTLLAQSQPDIIVLTGDIIDAHHTNAPVAAHFVEQAQSIAPVYYVTGNHESGNREAYATVKAAAEHCGALMLNTESVTLERGGASITLAGLHDLGFDSLEDQLVLLSPRMTGYTILLAHRPERIGIYAGAGADLVFSGHAHGGQFRLPFVGGLLSPGQGFFPTYDAGLYHFQDTQLVVSRGLGNSSFPIRLNNRPELILVQLQKSA